MALKKDKDKKGEVHFNLKSDFTIDTNFEKYYVFKIEQTTGNPISIDIWSYAMYYFENIQRKLIKEDIIYIDGIRIDKYMEIFCRNVDYKHFENYINEISSYCFQTEFEQRTKMHLNIFALYGLCMYVREIINRRYCFMLKPTSRELLGEIGDCRTLKSISLNTLDNKSININTESIIDTVITAIKNNEDNYYEFDHLAKAVDVFSKEYGQIEFYRAISHFFHDYFKIERRKNGFISITEQRIICFLLYYFGFSPEIIQETRIRQLKNSKLNICESLFMLNSIPIPIFKKSNAAIYLEYIPYSAWKNGRINALTYKPMGSTSPEKKYTFSINMGHDKENLHDFVDKIGVLVRDCFG